MGLLFFRSRGQPGFASSTVVLCFQVVGVTPVAYKMMNSLWMHSFRSLGRCLRSSFGMPSGPGALLLGRQCKRSRKIDSSATCGSVTSCGSILSVARDSN